jgi:hypothetical protein
MKRNFNMMKTKKSSWLGGLAAAALLTVSAQVAQADITAKGSDTLVILAQKWAEVYMKANPEVKIQVTGGGSGTGFAALQNQTTDLANASRPIKAKEKAACIKAFKKVPTEYKVALDGLSVYVHEDNPVTELTLQQLDDVFTGKVTNWKDLGGNNAPITLYSRENSSGTYEFFKEHVLKKKDFAARAQTLQGTAQVIQAVAKEYRGMFEREVGADCKPEEAMTEAGKVVIAQTHVMLDNVVIKHTVAAACGDCSVLAAWVRQTQFSGHHFFCDVHARKQEDFGKEDGSYFFWAKLMKP